MIFVFLISMVASWDERVLHQWINRARVEPAREIAGCGVNCGAEEKQASCYTPVAPLMWDAALGVAARFHSDSMSRQGFFGHDTPCELRSDLSSRYPGSCDGSTACACASNGKTSPGARVGLFGGSYSGEIIAGGFPDGVSVFYGWLYETAPGAGCAFYGGPAGTNGHRWLMMKASGAMGAGHASGGTWGNYFSTDFGGGGTVAKIPSGAHYPRQAASIEFWANWFDIAAPSSAGVVVGTKRHAMTLQRGTATNGAWLATVTGLESGCHRYYFEFTEKNGAKVRHPSSGTFGVGDASTCPDYSETQPGPGPEPMPPANTRRRIARRP